MRRHPIRRSSPFVLGLVLVLLLVGCRADGVVDAGPLQPDAGPLQPDAPTAERPDSPQDPAAPTDRDADAAPADQDTTPGPSDDTTTPDPTGDRGAAQVTAVRLYYLAPGGDTPARAGPFLVSLQREVPATPRIALATLRELVDGPSAADRALIDDVSTAVPDTTLVLDVTIVDGLATANLSREFESGGGSFSMLSRLAQVVYTLTQFPTVDRVALELDGQPVTVFSGEGIVLDGPVSRADYLDLLPTVFVDTPAAGAEVGDRVRMTGMAAVFEATFEYRLETADGRVLADGFAMTDEGMGWGRFDVTFDITIREAGEGALTVFATSAQDGSVQAERTTPLVLTPR